MKRKKEKQFKENLSVGKGDEKEKMINQKKPIIKTVMIIL